MPLGVGVAEAELGGFADPLLNGLGAESLSDLFDSAIVDDAALTAHLEEPAP